MLLPLTLVAALPFAVQTPPEAAEEGRRHPLDRVVVLGASVTTGMELGADLAGVLEATLVREHAPVRAHHNVFFFVRPVQVGTEQVELALRAEPTLVIGIDFLFWFGYGDQDGAGGPLVSEEARLVLLDRGLALLDRLDVPLAVGDFPDMSEAIGKMLRAEQVPGAETLVRLNARLAAWARERGDVIVLPLARVIADMRSDRAFRIGHQEWPAGCSDLLLRPDRLHPTLEGMAAVAHLVATELVGAELIAPEDVDLDLTRVLERLGEPPPGGGEGDLSSGDQGVR